MLVFLDEYTAKVKRKYLLKFIEELFEIDKLSAVEVSSIQTSIVVKFQF